MKLFKTFAATAAVASVVMLSSCEDVTNMDPEELEEKGITFDTITIYNTWGAGFSGLDAKLGEGVSIASFDKNTGAIEYSAADSLRVDFKGLNSSDRASTLTPRLISTNGTRYANIDSSEYYKTDLKDLDDNFKDAADYSDTLNYSADKPYFVAQLGGVDADDNVVRGYALAHITAFDKDDASMTTTGQNGSVSIEYYYIPDSTINK
jgi:hypothetical protein